MFGFDSYGDQMVFCKITDGAIYLIDAVAISSVLTLDVYWLSIAPIIIQWTFYEWLLDFSRLQAISSL